MTAIANVNRNYYKKFLFLVEIDGVVSARFQTCSEIVMETADIDHFEGGDLIPNKSPGRVTVANVTLTRGVTDDLDLWAWFQQTVAAASLLVDPDFKRNLDVVALERNGVERRRWTLVNAYPRRFLAFSGDNNTDENAIEEIELRYDFPIIGGDNPL